MATRFLRSLFIVTVITGLIVQPLQLQTTGQATANAVSPHAIRPNDSGPYYLVLGDTLAYGDSANGYAGDIAGGVPVDVRSSLSPSGTPTVINMACPGESTVTFVGNGCASKSQVKYPGGGIFYNNDSTQLQAALDFIKDKPGQISLVTIDLGAYDILGDITMPGCSLGPTVLTDASSAQTNLRNIFKQLSSALNTYGDGAAKLIWGNYYNPYQNVCQTANGLLGLSFDQTFAYFNGYLQQSATTQPQSPSPQVADVYTQFGGNTLPNPYISCAGSDPYLQCDSTGTPLLTPTTTGYRAAAQAFEQIISGNTIATNTPPSGSGATATPTGSSGTATATPSPTSTQNPLLPPLVGPKSIYLSLGGTFAYGYQPSAVMSNTSPYTSGYSDDLFADLQKTGKTQYLINMACIGETTSTFVNGGCPNPSSLKYSYSGNQLAAAVAFIKSHPGQVSPVTINLGLSDIISNTNDFHYDPSTQSCVLNYATAYPDALKAITNLGTALSQIRNALNRTGDLIVMNYWNPYQNIPSSSCQETTDQSQQNWGWLFNYINTQIANTAANNGAYLADVYSSFGGSNPDTCIVTWFCSTQSNGSLAYVVPNSEGYLRIAHAFEQPLSSYPFPTPPATSTPLATDTGTATNTPLPSNTPMPSNTPGPTNTPIPLGSGGNGPSYYLALGDAATYGYQPNGDYIHGYVDQVWQALGNNTTLVNMACPGETTVTFMKGGCADLNGAGLKYPYSGDQLDAAVNFIKAHPGQIRLITLSLGAADIAPDININTCQVNVGQGSTDGSNAIQNLGGTIVPALQNALGNSAPIVLLNAYDPLQKQCPGTGLTSPEGGILALNGLYQTVAHNHNLDLADTYTAFGGANEDVCTYTWICSSPKTVDATSAGYTAIAKAVEGVLGIVALPPTATASPSPTSTTTGTPTNTPTSTATASPAATQPTATATTRVANPTATATPKHPTAGGISGCPAPRSKSKLALKVAVDHVTLVSGSTIVVTIRTAAKLHLALTLLVQETRTTTVKTRGRSAHATVPHKTTVVTLYRLVGSSTANAHGLAIARLHVTFRPSKRTLSTLSVVAARPCTNVKVSTRLAILPATKTTKPSVKKPASHATRKTTKKVVVHVKTTLSKHKKNR